MGHNQLGGVKLFLGFWARIQRIQGNVGYVFLRIGVKILTIRNYKYNTFLCVEKVFKVT